MEAPDFEQIAAQILRLTIDNFNPQWNAHVRLIVEQFRQVWNARGGADIADLEDALNGETFVDDLTTRLKALDR